MLRKLCAFISLLGVTAIGAGICFLHQKDPRFAELVPTIIQFHQDHPRELLIGTSVVLYMIFALSILVLFESRDSATKVPEPVSPPVEMKPPVTEKPRLQEPQLEEPQLEEPRPVPPKTEKKPEPAAPPPEPSSPPQEASKPVEAKTPLDPNAPPPVAYQILYMFQKEGRLLDFLMEDISGVDDGDLGGAIRPIHEGCKKILQERLIIEPIVSEAEGSELKLEKAVDPNAIKLTGNVPPGPPYCGVIVHRGWRLKECKLPELVSGWSGKVVAPAEVEIQ